MTDESEDKEDGLSSAFRKAKSLKVFYPLIDW